MPKTVAKTWAMTAVILLVKIVCTQACKLFTCTQCVMSVLYARLLFAYLRAASEDRC